MATPLTTLNNFPLGKCQVQNKLILGAFWPNLLLTSLNPAIFAYLGLMDSSPLHWLPPPPSASTSTTLVPAVKSKQRPHGFCQLLLQVSHWEKQRNRFYLCLRAWETIMPLYLATCQICYKRPNGSSPLLGSSHHTGVTHHLHSSSQLELAPPGHYFSTSFFQKHLKWPFKKWVKLWQPSAHKTLITE